MEYRELIEDIRKKLTGLVNQRCDNLISAIETGEFFNETDYKFSYKLASLTPSILKGKKPLAVKFDSRESVEVETWKSAVEVILNHCNEQPELHKRLVQMCDAVAGKQRVILSKSSENMDVPLKVDENMYFELKFDTESLIRVLVNRVLKPVGYDIGQITIEYSAKKNLELYSNVMEKDQNFKEMLEETIRDEQSMTMQGM